ncbi:rhomboid family intramembrane serine protease [Arenibaculum pallidiluteum]|uniref:rhomboid family intramembrane serine protease n=1 Tax=Arenibaculum pallidiluteum TaxID=2812559 RepID=UPI001A97D06F|nr:rhomboid family intramembrane serine protease [Arenibaculum pallidiluteum]
MFFLPISDDNPTRRAPVVTLLIIGLCIAVFLWQQSLRPDARDAAVYAFGVIPAVLFGIAALPPELSVLPPWGTIVTSMFMHGGFMHVIGNMLYLWIFGNNVEDSMGRGRFLLFYLLCGLAAAMAQAIADPSSEVPMIGASGAIGGVLGAYIVLHPQANVRVFAWIIIFVRMINVPAVIVLGMWFAGQLLSGFTTPTDGGGVAFWAHVGGFVAGMALIPFFRDRHVPLFQGAHTRPFAVMPPPGMPRRGGSVPQAGSRRWPRG